MKKLPQRCVLLAVLLALVPTGLKSQDRPDGVTPDSPPDVSDLAANVTDLQRELKQLHDERNRRKEELFNLNRAVESARVEKRTLELEAERLARMIAKVRGSQSYRRSGVPADPIRFDARG